MTELDTFDTKKQELDGIKGKAACILTQLEAKCTETADSWATMNGLVVDDRQTTIADQIVKLEKSNCSNSAVVSNDPSQPFCMELGARDAYIGTLDEADIIANADFVKEPADAVVGASVCPDVGDF